MKTINESTPPTKRNHRMITIRLLGYLAAALIALQPFLESEVKTGNSFEVTRYILRIVITVMIAVLGKYLKERESIQQHGK